MSDPNLTEALAQQNPKAYAARFKRLTPGERSDFGRKLAPTAYFHHARALGETPMVEVDLSLNRDGALGRFEVSFGGLRVTREDHGWADAKTTLEQVLAGLPEQVGVEGNVSLPADAALGERFFRENTLGWKGTEVHFTTSDLSDGGRIRYAFVEGVVIITGTTTRGHFRARAALQSSPQSYEASWQACAQRLGFAWRRS